MPRGGRRDGAGRPKGSTNGTRKKRSNFKCEETFNCVDCSGPISAKRASSQGTCNACAARRRGRLICQAAWVDHECAHCGVGYSSAPKTTYCTAKCRQAANNEKRDAIRRSEGAHKNIGPMSMSVLRNSNWQCAACGADTPEALRGTANPRAPEVDHIIPLARGGKHEFANLQCLCKACNLSKGTKLMSEWVPANDNRPPMRGAV